MLKSLWSRISVWRWRWVAAIGVAIFGALAAMGLVRRRDLPKRSEAERQRESNHILECLEQSRQAAREKAMRDAEAAEWAEKRAQIEAQRVRHLPPTDREAEVQRIKERLRKTGRSLVILGCLLTAGSARAAEPMDHPSTLTAGWWMDDAEHAETAAWLTELADLRDAYAALKTSNASYQEAARHDATQVAVSTSLVHACGAQLDLAQAERDELQEDARRWYRRPAVLLGVGFGSGIALVTAIVLGAR